MRLSLMAWCLLMPGAAVAQAERPNDPVTGKWGSDGLTYLELRLDTTRVSGITIWRHPSGYEHRAAITTGTFDAKTGAVKLAGRGKGPDGVEVEYVIEGTVDGDTIAGTFKIGADAGAFRFTRQ